MFVGEVLIVVVILALTRRMADTPAEEGAGSTSWAPRCRRSASGLVVFGILRSGTWGFVQPKPGAARSGWGCRR